MADMELVIKIPEYMFTDIQDRYRHPNKGDGINLLEYAVANGIPLPEHYGDLIDREAIKKRAMFVSGDNLAIEGVEVVTVGMIDNAPTIIPATKEGDGE